MNTDVYFHKVVTYRAWRHELQFQTSQELFSSHDIDTGTKFLLRTIVEAGYSPPQRILDLGCGYGALGLTLKSLYPDSAVHLTDRDALAVEYTRWNAELNKLSVETCGSLGYDDVNENKFDLIVSNIPGKAGEPVITYLLREARFCLAPGGIMAAVVVTPLEETVTKILAATPGAEVILKRDRPGHAVFHYRFKGESIPKTALSALERGVYRRKDVTMRFAGPHAHRAEYKMQTAYGLPEFDSLTYDTEMLIEALQSVKNKESKRAAVLNPGQGHIAVAVYQFFHPRAISLIDRDLLALRYSKLNLLLNGCPAEIIELSHKPGPEIENREGFDIIAGVLRDAPREAIQSNLDAAVNLLSPGGLIILSGSSTAITRLVTYIESGNGLMIKSRERRRGYSAVILRHE